MWSELKDFLNLTAEELDSYNSFAKDQEETPFMRRTKIRIVFSCIEAHVFHLKSTAYTIAQSEPDLFSEEILLKLQDLRKNSRRGFEKAKIPLKENIKLAFSSFAKAAEREYDISFGDRGGQRFLQAVEVRNRITHPKRPSDWRISDEDDSLVDEAWHWFGKHLVAVSEIV